jgi:hypothetical protein
MDTNIENFRKSLLNFSEEDGVYIDKEIDYYDNKISLFEKFINTQHMFATSTK